MEIKTWYGEKGFTKNPFSSEPLTKEEVMTKAFIDRTQAKKDLEKFIQEKSGAVIIMSEIGHGKSSIINFAEKVAENSSKVVLRLDPRVNEDKICFLKSLCKEVIKKIINHNNDNKDILNDFIKLGDEHQIQGLMNCLKCVFDKSPSVLIMDDLDKFLDFKKHIEFIKEVIDLLPKNLQIITTGDINQVRGNSKVVSILYSTFDFPIVLEEVNNINLLKEFIYGRMTAYSKETMNIQFDDDIFEILIDRTRGNLREVFRYLSELLKSENYSKNNLIRTILKIDIVRLELIDERDKNILLSASGENKGLQEIKESLKEMSISLTLPTIRARLDELHQNCWVYKMKSKDSKKIIYSAPAVFKEMIKILDEESKKSQSSIHNNLE